MLLPDPDVLLVSSEATWPLRHVVLRPGRPLSACHWDGDDLPGTRHFGLHSSGEIVGVATLLDRGHEIAPPPGAWQLRGMAVLPTLQGQGLGARLLTHVLHYCRVELAGRVMWCNARKRAASLYLRHGFAVVGDEFQIEGIGPHYRMRHTLS